MEPNEGPSYAHVVSGYLCNFSLNGGAELSASSCMIYIRIYIYIYIASSLAANGSRKILPSHTHRERDAVCCLYCTHIRCPAHSSVRLRRLCLTDILRLAEARRKAARRFHFLATVSGLGPAILRSRRPVGSPVSDGRGWGSCAGGSFLFTTLRFFSSQSRNSKTSFGGC